MTDTKRPREPFAPWDRRSLPGLFDVDETAKRIGHYKWIEIKLFEALGGWVATVPELDIKMRLGTHCYHHAWHADLFTNLSPLLKLMKCTGISTSCVGRILLESQFECLSWVEP